MRSGNHPSRLYVTTRGQTYVSMGVRFMRRGCSRRPQLAPSRPPRGWPCQDRLNLAAAACARSEICCSVEMYKRSR